MDKQAYKQANKDQKAFDKQVAKNGDKVINPWAKQEDKVLYYTDESKKPKSVKKQEKKLAKAQAKYQKTVNKINGN